jgi:hypothetical protein
MKRWFPVFFLGLSLLANTFLDLQYINFLNSWTLASTFSSHQPLGLFALFSVPVGLFYLWRSWGPGEKSPVVLDRMRMRCGNTLLVVSTCTWIYFHVDSIVSAWMAETSTSDPLKWLWLSYWKGLIASISLLVGGALALWLKGVRMPPHNSRS